MSSIFNYEGISDIGFQKTSNEDFVEAFEFDEKSLLLVIADGIKSDAEGGLHPASVAVQEIGALARRVFQKSPNLLSEYPDFFLSECLLAANRLLTVFTASNDERYAGFACSISCCLLYRQSEKVCATIASAGNTRVYLIRMKKGLPSIHQLTTDHTRGADMVLSGLIKEEEYYTHLDRLVLTSGIGVLSDPKIQILDNLNIKKDDILLMTTDGIHYAIRPEALCDIVLQSGSCSDAVKSLIEAAKLEKYPDNMSAIVVYIP